MLILHPRKMHGKDYIPNIQYLAICGAGKGHRLVMYGTIAMLQHE